MFVYMQSKPAEIATNPDRRTLDVERGMVFAETLTQRGVPGEFISMGSFPFSQDDIEFYFYLYEELDVAQSFDWLIWR